MPYALREHEVAYTDHPYDYEPRGGTAASARKLGVDEHSVIKTPIMDDDQRRPMFVLMSGWWHEPVRALMRVLKPALVDVAMARG